MSDKLIQAMAIALCESHGDDWLDNYTFPENKWLNMAKSVKAVVTSNGIHGPLFSETIRENLAKVICKEFGKVWEEQAINRTDDVLHSGDSKLPTHQAFYAMTDSVLNVIRGYEAAILTLMDVL